MAAKLTPSRTFRLRRNAQAPCAEAFAAIVRLHGEMVYGVGLRITGDAHYAADVTQETFFHLLQNAGRITGSLGGWLHQVATRRAIDLVRRDRSRLRREQEYAAQAAVETDSWAELSPMVDEALSELDEESRGIIVRHFLQGRTMVEIAAEDGVSQPTVSRRVELAVLALRERLRLKGVGVAAGVLGGLLASSTASAMPASVLAELGKMSALSAGAASASAKTALSALKLKMAAAVAIVGVGGGAYYVYKSANQTPPPAAPTTAPARTVPRANAPVGGVMVPVARRPGRSKQARAVPIITRTNTAAASSNRPGLKR